MVREFTMMAVVYRYMKLWTSDSWLKIQIHHGTVGGHMCIIYKRIFEYQCYDGILISFYHTLSYFIIFYHVLSYFIMFYHLLSCFTCLKKKHFGASAIYNMSQSLGNELPGRAAKEGGRSRAPAAATGRLAEWKICSKILVVIGCNSYFLFIIY